MRTCGSNQTAPRPGLFTEPQPAVTQPEISHCCQYYLCILFLKSWEALRGSFFLKRKLPCLICFPQKLELYRISFSLCGLHDNVFKAFHVFCRVLAPFGLPIFSCRVLLGFPCPRVPPNGRFSYCNQKMRS